MDEKDMSEMVAWSVKGLEAVYSTILELRSRGSDKAQDWVSEHLIGAFVAVCNRDLPDARKALMEHETLADVIKTHLKSHPDGLINESLPQTSVIKLLLELGVPPKSLRRHTTFMHMWGMDPKWVDWALSNIFKVNKKDRTENPRSPPSEGGALIHFATRAFQTN